MRCRIVSCYTEAVAGGLCAKHYMRLRRTGDPTVTRKPGAKPGPKPGDVLHAHSTAEAEELAGLRRKVATLREESIGLHQENSALRGEVASLRRKLVQTQAPPKLKQLPPQSEVDAKLRAEIRELKVRLRRIAEAPRGALIISAADVRKIRRCLHPDTETDPIKRKRLTEASQIFNGLPMHEVERDQIRAADGADLGRTFTSRGKTLSTDRIGIP